MYVCVKIKISNTCTNYRWGWWLLLTRELSCTGPFIFSDILDYKNLEEIVVNNNIDWLVHYSAVLSTVGEGNVTLAREVNITGTRACPSLKMKHFATEWHHTLTSFRQTLTHSLSLFLGLHNILDIATKHGLRVFVPSTIGAFGPSTPRDPTPELCVQRPRTIYGVSKVHAELMGEVRSTQASPLVFLHKARHSHTPPPPPHLSVLPPQVRAGFPLPQVPRHHLSWLPAWRRNHRWAVVRQWKCWTLEANLNKIFLQTHLNLCDNLFCCYWTWFVSQTTQYRSSMRPWRVAVLSATCVVTRGFLWCTSVILHYIIIQWSSGVLPCQQSGLLRDICTPPSHPDDCLRATLEILEAPAENLVSRTYNIHAMSITPHDLAREIQKVLPDLKVTYNVDPLRQAIGEITGRMN